MINASYEKNPFLRSAVDALWETGNTIIRDEVCRFCKDVLRLPKCRSHSSSDIEYKRDLAIRCNSDVTDYAQIATRDGSNVDSEAVEQALGDRFLGMDPYNQHYPELDKHVVWLRYPYTEAIRNEVRGIIEGLGLSFFSYR